MNLTPTTLEEQDFESDCVRGNLPAEFTEMAMGSDVMQIEAKRRNDLHDDSATGADYFLAVMHSFFQPVEST